MKRYRYTFIFHTNPLFEIRQAAKKSIPIVKQIPEKAIACLYPPFSEVMSIPVIGGPVKVAKLRIENTMPIRVPDLLASVVRHESAPGVIPCTAAPAIPFNH